MKHLLTLSAIAALAAISLVSTAEAAAGAVGSRQRPVTHHDDLPKLSDALAVAKSPFEPVTLAPNNPLARNDGSTTTSTTVSGESTGAEHHRLTTREVQPGEQEKESTASSEESTNTAEPEATTQKPDATTTVAGDTEPTTGGADESTDSTGATVKAGNEEEKLAPTTTTTSAPAAETSPASEQPAQSSTTSAPAEDKSEEAPATTTAPVRTEEVTPEPSAAPTERPAETTPDSTPESESISTTQAPTAASTEAPAAEQPGSTTAPAAEQPPASEAPAATTTTTAAPTTTTTTTTTTPEPSTTTRAPSSSTTSEAPESTAAPETTSSAPKREEDSNNKPRVTSDEKEDKAASCNHLPTYESDELQKVFREETTYRNGTIKGKFTYVNFDQRYRLVHYTRLPYGPVKIDLVEELGKPENTRGQQPPMSPSSPLTPFSDTPNAVLQLRNILPNSLFGFPFVGPNLGGRSQAPVEPKENGAAVGNENANSNLNAGNINTQVDDKSNMYFYSTEAISTPNLLTPSVPVSLLPGQKRVNMGPNSGADTLSQNLNDQLPAALLPATTGRKLEKPAGVSQNNADQAPIFGIPNQHQIQYNLASQTAAVAPDQGPLHHHHSQVSSGQKPGLVYTYLPHAPNYQYSPLPFYSFHQPNYHSTARQPVQQSGYNIKVKHESAIPEVFSSGHQTHQPHSHEHYIAPFMYSQPTATLQSDQPETSRLKLKVKTSKSLNHDTGRKSAPLRVGPAKYPLPQPINSPVEAHRFQQQQQHQQQQQPHRHRAGKQNHDLKQVVNTSPVVYHVLRSPVGRLYSLQQYNQVHAMAYDHHD